MTPSPDILALNFCDANMAMPATFLRHRLDPATGGGMELWVQACGLAIVSEFKLE